ncbi:response regulator transcription factor [Sphingomonas canadensis]|uniref:Response regulator transcription factor n=1 Tax=Sphingomonas canadensis TaxID=1219257 RepID=A0ABW3HBG2_9SPHN|nr:response regulator [Sphingomonas canadensis]MCW3838237.1 response regulator [Sphingomonas canadensis]
MTDPPIIAVVDDDRSIRTGVARLLRSAGYHVRLFDCAEAFLDDASLPLPSALLTDIHMPGMNGLDLQAALRGRNPAFEVLVMTAYPDPGDLRRAIAGGARCVLSKPFDADELLAHLEAATGGT